MWVAHAPGMPGTFSPPPLVRDPDMHHGTCVTHVPWCMPGSLIIGFLGSRWREKRSRHSLRMRNPQFCVTGKRPMEPCHYRAPWCTHENKGQERISRKTYFLGNQIDMYPSRTWTILIPHPKQVHFDNRGFIFISVCRHTHLRWQGVQNYVFGHLISPKLNRNQEYTSSIGKTSIFHVNPYLL